VNETIKHILARQSVREYKDILLTREQLDTLAAAALQAPSGRNSQPIHARFLQNADILAQMQVDFKNIVGWNTPVHTRSDKNPFYHNAPAFAFLFAEGDSLMDAGIMVQNIAVAAQSLGLGTCIVASVGALFADIAAGTKWRAALDIPKDYVFMIGICIGVPDEIPERKTRKQEQIAVLNAYEAC
jgi:nitroreductase